jgi:hypothetical protein
VKRGDGRNLEEIRRSFYVVDKKGIVLIPPSVRSLALRASRFFFFIVVVLRTLKDCTNTGKDFYRA